MSDADAEARWRQAMAAAQGGDSKAYHQLLEELLPEVRRLVRARLFDPNAVEDVVQNALLSIHRARHTYRTDRPFGPWMRAICRNAAIDSYRQARRRKEHEVGGEFVDLLPDPKGPREQQLNELSPILSAALEELPEKQREAVRMIQVEGLSAAEAAHRAGVTVSAVKVRAHRGYRALRARLQGVLE